MIQDERVRKALRSDLGINLVTNGSAVKTGNKIDGKDEYIKKIQTSITTGTSKSYTYNLNLNNYTIADIVVKEIDSSGNTFVIPYLNPSSDMAAAKGFYINSSSNIILIFGTSNVSFTLDITVKYY